MLEFGVFPPPRRVAGRSLTRTSIDTDVVSYDRTDPFTALNVLRTLLASLPARIGGCQFKLSPDEHKLSLHLLAIVEPFVGLSQSRRTLTRQPTEILDAIVFHIDAKHDLLALALSCRRMHAVVFPRHYDYRVIRCKASSLRVWNHLVVHRALARNVRRLEILDERAAEPELVPADITASDTDLESTDDELGLHAKHGRFLIAALARMTALDSLVWSCNHSLVSIDNVWPTILKCHTLRQVELNDNVVFADGALPESPSAGGAGKSSRQLALRELRTVALRSTKHAYGATKTPALARISAMLASCPNLEDLTVDYALRRSPGFLSPLADAFLLCGRWPHLRTLVLTNLHCTPHAAFAAFLLAHPLLEVLHLDLDLARGAPALPPGALPRLRELRAHAELASAVLQCPCAAPGRPLETLKGVRLGGGGPAGGGFLASLRAHGARVRRVELAGWREVEDVRRLAECAPQLVWLDVGKRTGAGAGRIPGAVCANVMEWAAVLARMPELATFHGVRFFYGVSGTDASALLTPSDRSRVRKNDEVAARLAGKCAKLRRVDHWDEGAGKVVVLLRDGEKARYEVRRVKG
ncbi:hypothetical protein B0H21DRAFT_821386 [Amylocystis lapponica]|nr:hypothetical protein B0H21DRAFT_821386 [Amylocystis lapponica]